MLVLLQRSLVVKVLSSTELNINQLFFIGLIACAAVAGVRDARLSCIILALNARP
jgi:hypothetical protein